MGDAKDVQIPSMDQFDIAPFERIQESLLSSAVLEP
jgi:hypothetical protein